MSSRRLGIICVLSLVAASGCTDLDSATNLVPEGPPMVRQVRMKEISMDSTGATRTARVFAFGTHPDAVTKDYPALGPNSEITATPGGQSLRVIVDELLVGNALEEIACRDPIDGGSNAYDRVPLGTTPDDIAKCSVSKDVLPSSCPGTMPHAVCLCQADAGCGGIAKGDPVGVLDVNQDGAADDTRMIAGAAGIKCGSIDVPVDQNASYWNPSGDQNKPAMGGFDAIGPAIVIAPDASRGLPTNTECQLVFADNVVDKQGNRICTPANGDIASNCQPGDMNAFKFKVDVLRLTPGFQNNGSGIPVNTALAIVANAPIAPASLTAITVTTMTGTPVTVPVTLSLPTSIKLDFMAAPLSPMTTYVVHVATTLTDTYGQMLPQMITYPFTTGA